MRDLSDQKLDYLIFLGDFLDSPNCSPDLYRFIMEAFTPIRTRNIPILLMLGDHEMSNPGRATPLIYFSEISGIQVLEEVCGLTLGDQRCMFLPPDVKDLSCLKDQEFDAIFFHGFLQKAKVSKNYRMYRDSDFSVEDFAEYGARNYFFGGIHIRQVFDVTKFEGVEIALYGGALFQHNFGEENNPTGYLIWNSEGGVTMHEIKAPRYKTVRFQGELFAVAEQLTKLALPEGQWHIRLILDSHFPGTSLDMLRRIATEKNFLSLHFETVSKQREVSRKGKVAAGLTTEHTSLEILEQWLKIRGLKDAKREIVLTRATGLQKAMVK
jgi:DNA repair exonuclease SbcCD nuclease subunit